MEEIAVRGTAIYKDYRQDGHRIEVLKGVDLCVRRSEVVAVTGPSGVGKSTLLHILGALDEPTSGRVEIEGVSISDLKSQEAARLRNTKIGFVFQFHHLLPEFSALENVMMPLLIGGVARGRASLAARELLGEVGLSQRVNHRPGELSGGEMQRVAVARALVRNPAVVLADEPSGNLDLANSELLHNLIWRLARTRGQAFVIATHDPDLAMGSDRIARLADGRMSSREDCSTPAG